MTSSVRIPNSLICATNARASSTRPARTNAVQMVVYETSSGFIADSGWGEEGAAAAEAAAASRVVAEQEEEAHVHVTMCDCRAASNAASASSSAPEEM